MCVCVCVCVCVCIYDNTVTRGGRKDAVQWGQGILFV